MLLSVFCPARRYHPTGQIRGQFGPTHACHLATALQGEDQELQQRAERIIHRSSSTPGRPQLGIGEHSIAADQAALKHHAGERVGIQQLAIDSPVEGPSGVVPRPAGHGRRLCGEVVDLALRVGGRDLVRRLLEEIGEALAQGARPFLPVRGAGASQPCLFPGVDQVLEGIGLGLLFLAPLRRRFSLGLDGGGSLGRWILAGGDFAAELLRDCTGLGWSEMTIPADHNPPHCLATAILEQEDLCPGGRDAEGKAGQFIVKNQPVSVARQGDEVIYIAFS
jgi:hypothetical protein